MSKTIWKFEFEVADNLTIEMPLDAVILSCQVQNENPCIWALVDAEKPVTPRYFKVFGTGAAIDENEIARLNFIATFQLLNGSFVGHLFEDENLQQSIKRLNWI